MCGRLIGGQEHGPRAYALAPTDRSARRLTTAKVRSPMVARRCDVQVTGTLFRPTNRSAASPLRGLWVSGLLNSITGRENHQVATESIKSVMAHGPSAPRMSFLAPCVSLVTTRIVVPRCAPAVVSRRQRAIRTGRAYRA